MQGGQVGGWVGGLRESGKVFKERRISAGERPNWAEPFGARLSNVGFLETGEERSTPAKLCRAQAGGASPGAQVGAVCRGKVAATSAALPLPQQPFAAAGLAHC